MPTMNMVRKPGRAAVRVAAASTMTGAGSCAVPRLTVMDWSSRVRRADGSSRDGLSPVFPPDERYMPDVFRDTLHQYF